MTLRAEWGTSPNISKAVRKECKSRDKGRCRYCGDVGTTLDHILPKSQGGSGRLYNIALACKYCNTWKSNRTPDDAGMVLLRPGTKLTTEEAVKRRSGYRHLALSRALSTTARKDRRAKLRQMARDDEERWQEAQREERQYEIPWRPARSDWNG